ncbi:helix-turn-helix domain-containing protein [Adlercreutzia equolifaciens]|nr:helix-turn-helix transcriptional regulator [Adlercreutzia equolifaciens]MCP2078462.1 helix-turn-helix protein [Adlercreutzia equolifaciens subsp. celatus DSM 18785]
MDERIEALGAAVREARQRRELSQEQLASMMGTDQSAIARLEAGKINSGIGTYIRAADALGIPFKSLVNF